MVHQQCSKQHAQVNQGKAEGLAGQSVRIIAPQRERVPTETEAEQHGGGQIDPGTHAVDERHHAPGQQDQRVQEHLQTRELIAMRSAINVDPNSSSSRFCSITCKSLRIKSACSAVVHTICPANSPKSSK